MVSPRVTAGALALGCVVLGLTAAPASAGPALPATLTVLARTGNESSMAALTCDPVGGSHPNAQTACMELAAADGEIDRITPLTRHRFCPMIYMPIEVTAVGTWHGKPVLFHDTYPNPCVRDNHTGDLFRI